MPQWLDRLRQELSREKPEEELERELAAHLAEEEDDQREAGVPPEEAGYAARRAFGSRILAAQDTRSAWDVGGVETLFRSLAHGTRQDLVYALRGLRKQPAFVVASVSALALGIGAATTISSVIRGVLLDPYP